MQFGLAALGGFVSSALGTLIGVLAVLIYGTTQHLMLAAVIGGVAGSVLGWYLAKRLGDDSARERSLH